MTAPAFARISDATPATLTFFWNERGAGRGRPFEFDSFECLAEYFEIASRWKRAEPCARLFTRGYCLGNRRRLRPMVIPPYLVALEVVDPDGTLPLHVTTCRLTELGVPHVGLERELARAPLLGVLGVPPTRVARGSSYLIVADVLAPSWIALELATRELARLIGVMPATKPRSWIAPAIALPIGAEDAQPRLLFGSLRGDWLPASDPGW